MMNAAVLAMLCTAAVAEVIHVPGDAPTIQAGIDLATDGDEVIVADGVYTGAGNRDIDFTGKAITVRSEHGAQQCIIDCQATHLDTHRGVLFRSGETAAAVLEGFTIRNGRLEGDQGGGIRCDGSSPTIANCIITDCSAVGYGGDICCAGGGGIYTAGGNPTIVNCLLFDNHAVSAGGGIACGSGHALVVGCTIENNTTLYSGSGGGIWGDVTIIACDIIGNFSGFGGGISGAASIINCRVLGNSAFFIGGGGAYVSGLVANCLVAGNATTTPFYAYGGGGLYCSGPATITNCTVVYNASTNGHDAPGGGIMAVNGAMSLRNSIVRDNTAKQGAQIAAFEYPILDPTTLTIAHCNIPQGPSDTYIEGGAELLFGAGNFDADPMFVDADGPDGIPGTLDDDLRLGPGSPCIDAGWNNAAMFDTADLDGNPRFADDPATKDTGCGVPVVVDVGAYEYPGKEGTVVFGDVNGDGALRINDLRALVLCLGSDDPGCCVADLDLDGAVGVSDQSLLLARLLDFIAAE